MLAVNTLGVLHILENGESVSSVADLKGKTIWSTGQGANPEYILRKILTENGLDPDKDVTIEFVGANDELVAALVSGKATIAMVPGTRRDDRSLEGRGTPPRARRQRRVGQARAQLLAYDGLRYCQVRISRK